LKNFEIPANEISALNFFLPYYTGEDFEASDTTSVFPATFIIAKTVIEAYFKEKCVDPTTLKLFNSEGDSDDKKFPKFGELISLFWGFGDDIPFPLSDSDDLFFQYGWSDNYNRIYEITINGKPALLLDVHDGTTGNNFSMLEIILQA